MFPRYVTRKLCDICCCYTIVSVVKLGRWAGVDRLVYLGLEMGSMYRVLVERREMRSKAVYCIHLSGHMVMHLRIL